MSQIVINNPTINDQEWELDSFWNATDLAIRLSDEWRAYLNGSLNRIDLTNADSSSEVFFGLNYDTTYTWYIELWYQGELIDTSNVEEFHTENIPGSNGDPPDPPDPPVKAIAPGPFDDETNVGRATNLTWRPGNINVDNYDVYFGTVGNIVLVATGITDEFFDIYNYSGNLSLGVEYEWRIDSFNSEGTKATGDIWSYTTRIQRTVVLSAPANGATGLLLPPFLLDWAVDGIGPQYGSSEDQDYLFIYVRKDDANFTEDNLISNFLQAFYNDDLQIVTLTSPVYGVTYYWQVQAGNTSADLADSEVWSFTILDFLPPVVPGGATPTGENNMLTVRRLVAAAKNKIYYENL